MQINSKLIVKEVCIMTTTSPVNKPFVKYNGLGQQFKKQYKASVGTQSKIRRNGKTCDFVTNARFQSNRN